MRICPVPLPGDADSTKALPKGNTLKDTTERLRACSFVTLPSDAEMTMGPLPFVVDALVLITKLVLATCAGETSSVFCPKLHVSPATRPIQLSWGGGTVTLIGG